MPFRRVMVNAELLVSEDGKTLRGWTFRATTPSGRRLLDRLMDGKVAGLEYCENRTVRAISGGDGEYSVAFPRQ